MNKIFKLLLILCVILPKISLASELNCGELNSVVHMIRANSVIELNKYRLTSGNSYRSDVIFSFKYFDIMKNDASAAIGIYKVLPANNEQYVVWMTMGDSFCEGEKTSDMEIMGKFGARLPLLLSQAVIAHPGEMRKYIKFSLDAAQDPHSNLLFGMRQVCLARHEYFKRAVNDLPVIDRDWFIKHIMQTDSCHPLILPESD